MTGSGDTGLVSALSWGHCRGKAIHGVCRARPLGLLFGLVSLGRRPWNWGAGSRLSCCCFGLFFV